MTGYRFRIFTDEELHVKSMQWNGKYYDRKNMKSCNNILAHFENSQEHNKNNPFISQNVNLQNLDYVFLSSYSLGYSSYNSKDGERHVIKKIPLGMYGEYIHTGNYFDINDFIPVHKISLSRLKFMVADPYGNIIDLHGANISFSLLFVATN